MNLAVLVILLVVLALIALVVLPRVRRITTSERTTVERRSGDERRHRRLRVPVERRKRARRAEDVAKQYVSGLESRT